MASKNLKQKAAAGMVWTAFQKYSKMIVSFIAGIILARLLSPKDYGCIGMLTIFMSLADTFIDGGFGSALIQKKKPSQQDYSTIFWWNIGMAVFLYFLLFISAPAIARFYDIPLLCSVLRVQALVLFSHAFNLVQRNQLRKNLNFKLLSMITVLTSLVSLSITIILAYHGFGVWALVAQNILVSAIPAVVFWFYVKWRPMWVFSKDSFKELFSFGGYMFLTHLVNTFCGKLNGLLIGKLYSPATLGYFSKAMGTEHLASTSISSIISQVTYPLYAQVQDNKAQLGNMIKRLTTTIAYLTFPMMFLLMLIARPLFVLLYSDKWLTSVPFFQVLCLVGISTCLQAVNTQTLAAIGKSKTMFTWTLAKRTVGLIFMVGGLILGGMYGFLIGVIIYNWFSYFVNIGLVSKHIGYSWQSQLLDLLPMAVASICSMVISYYCVGFLHLGLYADGLMKMIMFILLYIGWSVVFKPESYLYTLSIIPSRIKFWKKR